MKPINHFLFNSRFTSIDSDSGNEVKDICAYVNDKKNLTVTLWKLSWKERISAIFGGNVWLQQRHADKFIPTRIDLTIESVLIKRK